MGPHVHPGGTELGLETRALSFAVIPCLLGQGMFESLRLWGTGGFKWSRLLWRGMGQRKYSIHCPHLHAMGPSSHSLS